MSVCEIDQPNTEHSEQILKGAWPAQGVTDWAGFGQDLEMRRQPLFAKFRMQCDITDRIASMSGKFIRSAHRVATRGEATLKNWDAVCKTGANQADLAVGELYRTKEDQYHIVKTAEEAIAAARAEAKAKMAAARAKATVIGAAAAEAECKAIAAALEAEEQMIVDAAHASAIARAAAGAATVNGYLATIQSWQPPNSIDGAAGSSAPATPMSTGTGGTAGQAPPTAPAPGGGTQNAGYDTFKDTPASADGTDHTSSELAPASNNQTMNPADGQQQPTKVQDAAATNPHPGQAPATTSSVPPPAAAPSTGGSGVGSGPGAIGHLMQAPMSAASSMGSSPASSAASPGSVSPASAAGGMPGSAATPQGVGGGSGAGTGAGASVGGAGAGTAGLGRAVSAAGSGAGIGEAAARMGTGAVSATASAAGNAANVGSQVAQTASAAANSAAATTPPPQQPPVSGSAPMAMMPPATSAGAATPVTSVSSPPPATPATPVTAAGGPPVSSGPPLAAGAPSGAQVAPLAMPQQHGIPALGADGATGDLLFEQAMDAGHDVIAAMIAQTIAVGYVPIAYAVSLIYERMGGVTAWMATSEGASCIPLGVRVPQDVRLAVTDPVIGRELWEATAASGVASPLEVVVRHAEAREMAAPGTRVLAIASSLPMDQVCDWAREVSARAVEVKPSKVSPAFDFDGNLVHRCQVAMPWEWRQANAFSEQQRLQIAARHMHMAVTAGHLHGAACEKVMRLFEERKPIDEDLWASVRDERFIALVEYEQAVMARGHGGSEPARALATVRAAEVIESLRHFDTVEGCADLLYATRLAGVPLSPAAAAA